MKDEKFLEKKSIRSLYLQMVIPAVAAQLVNLAYTIVDRIYIGHIPETGKISLAGSGICLPVIMMVAAFAQLGGVGGASRFSFFMGSGNRKNAEGTMSSCAAFLLACGILLTLSVRLFSSQILLLFGAEEETLPYAFAYLNTYALGTVFVEFASGMAFFITAQGMANISLISVLLGAGLNTLLDPLFIYVFHMGVRGAAVATVIAQGISAGFVFSYLTGKKVPVRLDVRQMRHIHGDLLKNALALGISPFVMQMTESIVNLSFNRNLMKFGGVEAVGAMAIFASIMSIVFNPLMGIGQGVQPIIAYNYGAGLNGRVKKTCLAAWGSALAYSVSIWLVIRVFPGLLISMFSSDKTFIAYAISMVGIYFGMIWVMGAQVVTQNMFIALGNAKISLFLALLRKIFLLLPLIYLLPMMSSNKVAGVFMAEPVADTIAVIFTMMLFYCSRVRSIRCNNIKRNMI